ncbi:hypothetical protein DFR76_110100 [Nocardia pseudobrasiliensis]|uniref:Uncharacterized protein n=2 Tax=Nocardia pseudobrasiliensis TaxID=45979 RepID=A0A370HY22_9NOCA|nr:hypothetical protein DFR76_110100 [Nocardia pseudobrasiliensis]
MHDRRDRTLWAMKKSTLAGRVPANTENQSGSGSLATQLIQVMSAAATVITALAAYIACASVLNIPTVSILSAACLAAGWLARSRPWRQNTTTGRTPPVSLTPENPPDDRLLRRLRARKDR